MESLKFTCPTCQKPTTALQKTKKMTVGLQHNFLECAECGYKATTFYTDKSLRKLIKKQRAAPTEERKARIIARMNELKKEIEK